jgi:predicted membrane-bound spermidine synthase
MRNKLMLLAFLEGGLVMLLETASPIVSAPVLGHSVQVWATLLSLSVGSLAIGYFLGAWFTRTERNYTFLMRLFTLNAFLILIGVLLLYFQNYSSTELVSEGYTYFMLFIVLVLPLIIFGSTTPVIIDMINRSDIKDSSVAGSVFSLSTVGGIIFSILTGYVLIDSMGISKTILIGLILTAILPVLHFLKEKNYAFLGFNALFLITGLFLFSKSKLPTETESFKTLHFSEGISGQLIVADYKENNAMHRVLLINRMGQTKLNLETNFSAWPYVNYLTSAASMYPAGSRSLVLGLGGGTVPNQLKHYLGHDVEAVELDERIIELSDLYFDNLNAGVRKTADDARRFVKSATKKYDYIVLDIFNGEIMPSHGLSKEAFEDIDAILKPGGLIAINFNGFVNGKEGLAGRSLVKTLKNAGFKVSMFDCGAGKEKEQDRNMLYFAYKEEPNWSKATIHTMIEGKEYRIGEHLFEMSSLNFDDALIITDDRPVMEYINRYAAASWRKSYLEGYTRKFRKEHKLPLIL